MKTGTLHEHALGLNIVFAKYRHLHQQGLQAPWWKSLPIPYIFKPINFEKLTTDLGKLSLIMSNKITEINLLTKDESATDVESRFAQGLLKYCETINTSMVILQKIYQRLFEKSKGKRGTPYPMSEYKEDLHTYQESVRVQKSIGYALNDLYAELGANDLRREKEDD